MVCGVTGCLSILILLLLNALLPFPVDRLARIPVSPAVTTREGRLLLQTVARDGQWRMPVKLSKVSKWLTCATIAAEDERFWQHPGVDPIAALRAAYQNATNLRIVSGASTLTMQVCRMTAPADRTLLNKLCESFRALQLERILTKEEILTQYFNDAPYGGNIRGAEAAALRYFGKHAADLALDEAALLAGLPQSPEKLRPDRHPRAAQLRRKWVLERMVELHAITPDQAAAAASAAIVLNTPANIPHPKAVAWAALARRPRGGRTTIDAALQQEVERIVDEKTNRLPPSTQAAVVVIDIETAEIRAWTAAADTTDPVSGQVDGVLARRSPGSALKPFIYATAFESQRLAPDTLLLDAPIERTGWKPHNFSPEYLGEVRADVALRKSLNIPAILLTEQIGLTRCVETLKSCGVSIPVGDAHRAGLALAVGGSEVSLLDLTNGYATIGRGGIFRKPILFSDEPSPSMPALSENVCATVSDILSTDRRSPAGEDPSNPAWFMWKTGTSSGRRDAWAVGHNTRFAVGVWVGRFSGAGNHGYVGRPAAEPILAAIFRLPAIRQMTPPPAPAMWTVVNPLPKPVELDARLRILSPQPGDRFVSLNDQAVIHARANQQGPVYWFLNGQLVGTDPQIRLTSTPGDYELRCCGKGSEYDEVRFQITQ